MGICPNCGSWVDEGDICMNCGGGGGYGYDDDEDESPYGSNPRMEKARALSDEVWNLRNEGRYGQALDLINQAIELYPYSSNYFNTKAIILQDTHRYEDALKFYDRALSFGRDRVILKNKASCILDLVDMKKYSGRVTYWDLNLLNRALEILPEGEDNYQYLQLKGNILEMLGDPVRAKICYYLSNGLFDEVDEADRQLKLLGNPNETYIIIAGTNFYQGLRPFHEGVILDMIREPDNKFDGDAIRVEVDGETVGYVANSERTLIREVKSATDIRNTKSTRAQFAFVLVGTYVIARVMGVK